jgi:uncharacterized protein (DUF697 family)
MALLGKSRKKLQEVSSGNENEQTATPASPEADENEPMSAEQEIRSQEAKNIIKNHVIGSMGISLVPIPLVDLLALTGIQLRMLHQLARLYRVPFSENLGKSLIISLVGGVMPTSTAITLASFVKAVPGLGTATGMVSVTLLGGATTYAVGSVFMQHFESGGTLLDFEPKAMREHFAKELRQGKQVAANLKKSK